MGIKVMFIGNPLGGDDGIGPYLFNELEKDDSLKEFELMEMGVIGFDLVSYVDDGDKLIIVDAVKSEQNIGDVVLLGEDDLSKDLLVVSQHDFGIEQTAAILRQYKPNLKQINIVGIKVSNVQPFSDRLSDEIRSKIGQIKQDVIQNILDIANGD